MKADFKKWHRENKMDEKIIPLVHKINQFAEEYATEKAIEFGKYVWKIDTVEAENKGLNLFDLGWEKFIEKAYQKFNGE